MQADPWKPQDPQSVKERLYTQDVEDYRKKNWHPLKQGINDFVEDAIEGLYQATAGDMLTDPRPNSEFSGAAKWGAAIGAISPLKALKGLKLPRMVAPASTRLARAAEQGYRVPVYHGTTDPNVPHFPSAIAGPNYDFGIHVTPRPETANKFALKGEPVMPDLARLEKDYKFLASMSREDRVELGLPSHLGTFEEWVAHHDPWMDPQRRGASVMPLLAKMDKTLDLNADVGIWKDPSSWGKRIDPNYHGQRFNTSVDQPTFDDIYRASQSATRRQHVPLDAQQHQFQKDLKGILEARGYDSFSYPNFIEGAGERSYGLLDPSQLRSTFAQFDPRNVGKIDLMGSVAPPIAGLAAAGELERQKRTKKAPLKKTKP